MTTSGPADEEQVLVSPIVPDRLASRMEALLRGVVQARSGPLVAIRTTATVPATPARVGQSRRPPEPGRVWYSATENEATVNGLTAGPGYGTEARPDAAPRLDAPARDRHYAGIGQPGRGGRRTHRCRHRRTQPQAPPGRKGPIHSSQPGVTCGRCSIPARQRLLLRRPSLPSPTWPRPSAWTSTPGSAGYPTPRRFPRIGRPKFSESRPSGSSLTR